MLPDTYTELYRYMYRALQVGSGSAEELKITQLNTTLAVQKLNYVQVVHGLQQTSTFTSQLIDMYRYSVYHHQIVTQPSCGSTYIGNNHCYDNT